MLLKHIELNLYIDASSMEEYADISTLKKRMVRIVKKMVSNKVQTRKEYDESHKTNNLKEEVEEVHTNNASQEKR